jgi:hypothetical protein
LGRGLIGPWVINKMGLPHSLEFGICKLRKMGRRVNRALVINKTGLPHSFRFVICNNTQLATCSLRFFPMTNDHSNKLLPPNSLPTTHFPIFPSPHSPNTPFPHIPISPFPHPPKLWAQRTKFYSVFLFERTLIKVFVD